MFFCRRVLIVGFERGMILVGLILSLAQVTATTAYTPGNPRPPIEPLILCGKPNRLPAGEYSPGVAELLKMLDAGINPHAIEAYILNSPVAYNPETAELVILKERGASAEVLVALLHRADELPDRRAPARMTEVVTSTTGAGDRFLAVVYPADPEPYFDPEEQPVAEANYEPAPTWPAHGWVAPFWEAGPRRYEHRRAPPGHAAAYRRADRAGFRPVHTAPASSPAGQGASFFRGQHGHAFTPHSGVLPTVAGSAGRPPSPSH
jgi:hypothetical protein